MKRITKNLLVYWQFLGSVLLLFLIQISCINGISHSVHGMKQTGAGNQGIAYRVSEAITSDAWQQVELYMSDLEQVSWNSSYEKADDGIYYLKDSLKTEKNMKNLEQMFLVPQAVVWKISTLEQSERTSLLEEYGSPFEINYSKLRDDIEAELEGMGSETISEYAMQFVQVHSQNAGVDLGLMKTQYFSGSIFLILFWLLVLAGSAVAVKQLLEKTEQFIRRRITEWEVRHAEILLMYSVEMFIYGMLVYGFGGYQIVANHSSVKISLEIGVLLLMVGLIGMVLLRNLPRLQPFYEKIAFTKKYGRHYLRWMRVIVVWGIPTVLLAAGITSVVSWKLAGLLVFCLVDLMLAVSVFLGLEIAGSVDCAEEIQEELPEEWE